MTYLILLGVFILGIIVAVGICRGGKCETDEHEENPGI